MRDQYKKMYEALRLSDEVNRTLKIKIYQEYRSRIIDLLSKKDKDDLTVSKIEAVL
jgi:hypothetical protein